MRKKKKNERNIQLAQQESDRMRAQRIYLEACMERDEYNYIEESVCVRIQWAQQTGNRNSVAMAIVMAVVHTKREHTTEVREQQTENEREYNAKEKRRE